VLSAMLVAQCVGDLGCMVADCYCLVHWLAALVLLFNYECGNSCGDKSAGYSSRVPTS